MVLVLVCPVGKHVLMQYYLRTLHGKMGKSLWWQPYVCAQRAPPPSPAARFTALLPLEAAMYPSMHPAETK